MHGIDAMRPSTENDNLVQPWLKRFDQWMQSCSANIAGNNRRPKKAALPVGWANHGAATKMTATFKGGKTGGQENGPTRK
jgi:hypothetical protein